MPAPSRGNRRRKPAIKQLPRIFISATTRDLAEARQHISNLVLENGCHPVVEQGFETLSNNVELARFLNGQLRKCAGVIHLAGLHYGGEVRHPGRNSERMSWTQMEYRQAKLLRKPILVGLAKSRRRYKESGSESEQKTKARLQSEHYEQLQGGNGAYYTFTRPADLDVKICGFLKQFTGATDEKVKVLFVGAQRGTGLDLRGQLAEIKRQTAGQPNMKIEAVFDRTAPEIIAEINKRKPTIVHLSGRQQDGTILLHDEKRALVPFGADQLASALAQTSVQSIRLIVLDTCYCMQQAKKLTYQGVPFAVGIYDAIAVDVSTEFYSTFYNQLAAGNNLKAARDTARDLFVGKFRNNDVDRIELEAILEMKFNPDIHVPALFCAKGANPKTETFL
jgi:Domain of unknown function (DUF4062)